MTVIIENPNQIETVVRWFTEEERNIILNKKPNIAWRRGEGNSNGYFSARVRINGEKHTNEGNVVSVIGNTYDEAEYGHMLLQTFLNDM